MTPTTTYTLVYLALISYRLSLTDFATIAAELCTDIDQKSWLYTDRERSKRRDARTTPISLGYDHIRAFLENNDYGALIEGTAGHFAVIIILVFCCLVSFIFYLLYFCYFSKYKKATEKKAKPFLIISAICLTGFLAFFAASTYYLVEIHEDAKEINCILYKMPADIMQGISGTDREYIGLRPLQDLLAVFTTEVYLFDSFVSDFTAIRTLNLRGNANSPIRALEDFYVKYRAETTTDGKGFQNRPLSIRSLTPVVSAHVGEEFNSLSNLAISFHTAADIGVSVGSNNREDLYADTVKQAQVELNAIIVDVDSELTSIASNMNKALDYSVISYFIGLAIGAVIIILAASLVIIMLKQSRNQRCMGNLTMMKIFLTLISFVTLCFAILSVFLFIVTTAVSSYCNFQEDMLKANDVQFFLNQYKLDLNPQLLNVISRCVTTISDGTLSDLLGYTDTTAKRIDDVQKFYDGFISFEKLYVQVMNNSIDSVAILNQVQIWRNYANGLNLDHDNVNDTIKELNKLVECGDVELVLNLTHCNPEKTICQSVIDTIDFKAPSCTKNTARANYLFTTLNQYLSAEQRLMTLLEQGLADQDIDTAHKRFRNLKDLLQRSEPYYQAVRAQFGLSFAVTASYKTNFDDFISCTRIREELEDLEAVICFNSNRDFYLFFVMVICSTCMLFLMNWAICIALRCVPDDTPITLKAHKSTDLSKIYFNDNAPIPI